MKLTILNRETQEPMLILDQDDHGLAVVGGDPKLVQALKLNQFKDLKEIADYLNSDPSGVYQAIFEDQQQEKQEDDPAKVLDDRMKPALRVIRDLMGRVKNRQDQDKAKEEAEKPEAKALGMTDSMVMQEPGGMIYVSYDGDNIGNAVARAERKDDENELRNMSNRINAGQTLFMQWAQQNNGEMIEQGGDEGLCKVPNVALKHIEEFRKQYFNMVGATCSVGTGKKISEATDARMLAKLKGKNCVEMFTETTRKELDLRLQDKDDQESAKIRESLQAHSDTEQPQDINQEQNDGSVQQGTEGNPAQAAGNQAQEGEADTQGEAGKADAADAPVSSPFSPELIQAMRDQLIQKDEKEAGPDSLMASPMHDPDIESADYSYSDDPEFSKSFRYAAKYGDRQ